MDWRAIVIFIVSLGLFVFFLHELSRVWGLTRIMGSIYTALILLLVSSILTIPHNSLGQSTDRLHSEDEFQQRQIEKNEVRIGAVERDVNGVKVRLARLELLAEITKSNSDRLALLLFAMIALLGERGLQYVREWKKLSREGS